MSEIATLDLARGRIMELERTVAELQEKLGVAEFRIKEIADLCYWYATIHRGPESEVHHALKVEVLDMAMQAQESVRRKQGGRTT